MATLFRHKHETCVRSLYTIFIVIFVMHILNILRYSMKMIFWYQILTIWKNIKFSWPCWNLQCYQQLQTWKNCVIDPSCTAACSIIAACMLIYIYIVYIYMYFVYILCIYTRCSQRVSWCFYYCSWGNLRELVLFRSLKVFNLLKALPKHVS